MELKDKPDELIPLSAPARRRPDAKLPRLDHDRAGVGLIEQAQDVKQGALAAAGRADDRMDGAGSS